MGKLGYSSMTLTDLTETIPVTLILESNQDSNVQIKTGNLYTPDFSKKDENNNFVKELIITPSLFLGNEEIKLEEHPEYVESNERNSGFIYYQIGKIDENGEEINYYYSASTSESIYVDILGCLHIRENLLNNITIEAYIDNFHNETHNYTIPLVQATNPINFLLLEDNGDNFFVVINSNGRQHFEETKAIPITLTAFLYQGANPFESSENLLYKWYKVTDGTSNNWVGQTLEVSRDMVYSEEKFLCEITVPSTGITYSGTIDIWDQTENYDCTIIANRQLLLSENFEDLILTANVYDKKGNLIESKETPQENGYYLTYQWGVASAGDGQDIEGETSQTLTITNSSSFLPKAQSFLIYCKVFNTSVTGTSGETTIAQIASENENIQFVPEYSVKITPQNIFIPISNNGEYQGKETYSFTFQLLDKNGNLIDYDTETSRIITDTDEDGTRIVFGSSIENKWNFEGTITPSIGENTWWEDTSIGSKTYNFTYVYRNQQFTEQLELIKNKAGMDGIVGAEGTGYTIHLSNESVSLPGDVLKALPNIVKEIEISAYKNTEQIPTKVIAINDVAIEGDEEISSIIGFQISISNNDSLKTKINFTTTEELESDGQISIDIQIDDKTFRKYWSYSISKTGAQGASGNTYQLIISPSILIYKVKDGIGQFLDSSDNDAIITTNAVKYQGVEMTPSSYTGFIEFYGATSNSNWTLLGTSILSSDSSWSNIDGLLQYRNFKFILYNSSDKERVLDEQTLPVIKDGYYSGGRNLILDSDIKILEMTTRQNSSLKLTPNIDYKTYFGQDLTLSFYRFLETDRKIVDDAPSWDLEGKRFGFYLYAKYLWSNSSEDEITTEQYYFTNSIAENNLMEPLNELNNQRYSATINFSEPINSGYVLKEVLELSIRYELNCYVNASTTDNVELAYLERPQLEFGDKATAWSAAPEDVSFANIKGINLIANSFAFSVPQADEDQENGFYFYDFNIPEKGDYTLSWSKIDFEDENANSLNLIIKVYENETEIATSTITSKTKDSITFKDLGENCKIQLVILNKIIISKFKIEKGQIATPWIVADTDLEQIISSLENYTNNRTNTQFVLELLKSNGDYVLLEKDEYKNFQTLTDTYLGNIEDTSVLEALTSYATFYSASTKNGIPYLTEISSAIQLGYDTENGGAPFLQLSSQIEGTNLSMRLTNKKLGFYSSESTEPLAYFSSSKLYITSAIVEKNFIIGSNDLGGILFIPTSTGVGITRIKQGDIRFSE